MNIDSMIYYASAISGEFPVNLEDTTVTIVSRNKTQPGNAFAADYIEQKLVSFGLTTEVQSWSATGENIIATQPGVEYPNQKYVICAHYDAIPVAVAPAADDDGSGTATLIEIARVLSQHQFVFTIEYCFWDEEEQGLVGSGEYSDAAEAAGDSLLGVVNMDAIAWDGDGDDLMRIHTRDIGNSMDLADVAESVNTTYNIGLNVAVNNPGATYSDHASFWDNDFGAILIIEDFDNDGNPHYHTETDLVQYFDTTYYNQMSLLSVATISSLAIPYDPTSSVGERSEQLLGHYPDPVESVITFTSVDENENFRLIDIHGKTIETGALNQKRLNVSHLLPGTYMIELEKGSIQKFIKK